jgi:hypothetical protein
VDLERKDCRIRAIRAASEHLRRGGSLLVFPAGAIEPDPALGALDARTAFMNWSASIDLFARSNPLTQIIPVLISGVLNPRAQTSFLAHLRTRKEEREWLGATLQLVLPWYRNVHAEIRFGRAVVAGSSLRRASPRVATDLVIAEMQDLLASSWRGQGRRQRHR